MRFDVNLNYPDEETTGRLCRLHEMLGIALENQETIMATFDDLKAAQAANSAKLDALLAKPAPAGMTAEQQAALDEAVAAEVALGDKLPS